MPFWGWCPGGFQTRPNTHRGGNAPVQNIFRSESQSNAGNAGTICVATLSAMNPTTCAFGITSIPTLPSGRKMNIMCHRKRKLALLLAGILTLSACAVPAAETSVPPLATRPEAVTPPPTPTPEPTHQPAEEPKELWGFPINDTHDAFEVPTGGKLGTVLVTVEMNEEEFISTVSVWDASDLTAPIQTMEEEGAAPHRRELLDANFDGYMDFTYIWALFIRGEISGTFGGGRGEKGGPQPFKWSRFLGNNGDIPLGGWKTVLCAADRDTLPGDKGREHNPAPHSGGVCERGVDRDRAGDLRSRDRYL